ncbi:MAG: hypothetical protein IJ407_04375 [Clostridia bacterium]|nr:hypothetical protein [Clostridia bacterium]
MIQKETDFKRSLAGLFYIIKKSLIGMIISGLVLGGSVGLFSKKFIDPKYSAKSALYIASASDSVLQLDDIQIGSSLTDDYIYLITSRPFITEMKLRIGLGSEYTYAMLSDMISVTNPTGTHAIEITTVCKDDKLAADISNALAEVSVTKLADIMESSHPKITEYAAARGAQVSPNSTMNAMVSFVLGALAFFVFSYLKTVSDDTIKSVEDIDSMLQLNVLGMVNEAPTKAQTGDKKRSRKKKSKKTEKAS